jgi:hypothetical protein
MSCLVLENVNITINGKSEKARVEVRLLGIHANLNYNLLTVDNTLSLTYKDIPEPDPSIVYIYVIHDRTSDVYKISCGNIPKNWNSLLRENNSHEYSLLEYCDVYSSASVIEWISQHNKHNKNRWCYLTKKQVEGLISIMRAARLSEEKKEEEKKYPLNGCSCDMYSQVYKNMDFMRYSLCGKDCDSGWKFNLFNEAIIGQHTPSDNMIVWPLQDKFPLTQSFKSTQAGEIDINKAVVSRTGSVHWEQGGYLLHKYRSYEKGSSVGIEGKIKLLKYKSNFNNNYLRCQSEQICGQGVIITLNEEDCIRIWDVVDSYCLSSVIYTGNVYDFDVLDSKNIITVSPIGAIIWDPKSGREVGRIRSRSMNVEYKKVVVLTNYKILLYEDDKFVYMWCIDNAVYNVIKYIGFLCPNKYEHLLLDGGELLVSRDTHTHIIIWNISSEEIIKTFYYYSNNCDKILRYDNDSIVIATDTNLLLLNIKSCLENKDYEKIIYCNNHSILDFCVTSTKNVCVKTNNSNGMITMLWQ